MLEKNIEFYLKTRVEKILKGKCYKFVSPGSNGVPDRIIILPGGKVYFVETKQEKGKLRELQKYRHNEIKDLGGRVFSVFTYADVVKFVDFLNDELNEVHSKTISEQDN